MDCERELIRVRNIDKKQFSILVEKTIYDKLKEKSVNDNRSLNYEVCEILERYFAEKE